MELRWQVSARDINLDDVTLLVARRLDEITRSEGHVSGQSLGVRLGKHRRLKRCRQEQKRKTRGLWHSQSQVQTVV